MAIRLQHADAWTFRSPTLEAKVHREEKVLEASEPDGKKKNYPTNERSPHTDLVGAPFGTSDGENRMSGGSILAGPFLVPTALLPTPTRPTPKYATL